VTNEMAAGIKEGDEGKHLTIGFNPNNGYFDDFDTNMGRISREKVKANWYDPRKGTATPAGEYLNIGIQSFVPPSSGRNNDWVLVLDDSSYNYATPGLLI